MMARLLGSSPKTKPQVEAMIGRLLKVCAGEIRSGRPGEGRFWLEQILSKVDKKHALTHFVLGKLLSRYPNESKRSRDLLKRAGSVKPPKWLGPLLKKLQKK